LSLPNVMLLDSSLTLLDYNSSRLSRISGFSVTALRERVRQSRDRISLKDGGIFCAAAMNFGQLVGWSKPGTGR